MNSFPLSCIKLDQKTKEIIDQLLIDGSSEIYQISIIKMVMMNMFKWVLIHKARIAHLHQKRIRADKYDIEGRLRHLIWEHEIMVEEMIDAIKDKDSALNKWFEDIDKNSKKEIIH